MDGFAPPVAGTETHRPSRAMRCGMVVAQDGVGWTVRPRDFPTNRGVLCRRGRAAASLSDAPDRLTTSLPRGRKDAPPRPATWDEALDRVAPGVRAIQATRGRDAVGVSGGPTDEKAYRLGAFARVAPRTANIDRKGRFCMASAVAGPRAYGIDRGLPFPMQDILGAEAVRLADRDPAEMPPPIMRCFDERRARGGRMIVADPRRTPTARTGRP